MRHLGIDDAWLDLGLVTIEQLRDFDQLDQAEDFSEHTEHYRYWCYCEFLKRTKTFSNETFRALMGILWNDQDRIMSNATLLDLSRHQGITPKQLEIIRTVAPRHVQKSIPQQQS